MKRLRTAFSTVLLSVATGSALGAEALPPVDHVDIDWEPNGHHGFAVPHYDVHLYFVPHAKHMAIVS